MILYREGGGRLGKKGRMIGVRGREGGREVGREGGREGGIPKLAHKRQLFSTTVTM